MMYIHKNLVLDHAYFATKDSEFEDLKTIFSQFTATKHSVVKTDEDQWEGLYISTRGYYYLEILRNRRPNSIGLCQKPFGLLSQDSRNIVKDFPNLDWKYFERTIKGKKWFTALSTDDYMNLDTLFNAWVMYYYKTDDLGLVDIPKYEITKINDIYFSANTDLKEKIIQNSDWINCERIVKDNEIIFKIQTYFSDDFNVHISLDNLEKGFKFKKAIFEIQKNIEVFEHKLKHFSFLKKSDNQFELLSND